MKIGIISDTHDNLTRIRQAVDLFNEKGTGFVIHAGDFVAPFAITPLENLKCQYVGVFGNNDGEKLGLSKKSQGRINMPSYVIELDQKKILVLHEPGEISALIKSQIYDIIIYGHTHNSVVEKHDRTLVINPGECCGWVTGKSSVALADLGNMSAEIIELV